jgi:hypothetical protein
MKIHSFTLAITALTTTLVFSYPEDAPKPPAAKEHAAEPQKDSTEAKPKSDDAAQPGSKREKAMLKKFDANGDGVLSDEEKATAKAKTEERQAKFLKKNDTNGDGVLSDEERSAAGLSGKKAAKGE